MGLYRRRSVRLHATRRYNSRGRHTALPIQEKCGSRTDNWAELFYTLGLIDEARGAENAAARSFLNALESTPGHEATNKAIDQLRERVRDKTGIEHVIVRHNIDNVLEPFRHRTPGQAPLGKEEARSIVEQFVNYTDDLHVSTTLSSIILPCLIFEK